MKICRWSLTCKNKRAMMRTFKLPPSWLLVDCKCYNLMKWNINRCVCKFFFTHYKSFLLKVWTNWRRHIESKNKWWRCEMRVDKKRISICICQVRVPQEWDGVMLGNYSSSPVCHPPIGCENWAHVTRSPPIRASCQSSLRLTTEQSNIIKSQICWSSSRLTLLTPADSIKHIIILIQLSRK